VFVSGACGRSAIARNAVGWRRVSHLDCAPIPSPFRQSRRLTACCPNRSGRRSRIVLVLVLRARSRNFRQNRRARTRTGTSIAQNCFRNMPCRRWLRGRFKSSWGVTAPSHYGFNPVVPMPRWSENLPRNSYEHVCGNISGWRSFFAGNHSLSE